MEFMIEIKCISSIFELSAMIDFCVGLGMEDVVRTLKNSQKAL